jgi:hypothetical protein
MLDPERLVGRQLAQVSPGGWHESTLGKVPARARDGPSSINARRFFHETASGCICVRRDGWIGVIPLGASEGDAEGRRVVWNRLAGIRRKRPEGRGDVWQGAGMGLLEVGASAGR